MYVQRYAEKFIINYIDNDPHCYRLKVIARKARFITRET
jgi:hypothetical protein